MRSFLIVSFLVAAIGPAGCGDELPEACSPSLASVKKCTPPPPTPYCGDGVVEYGEHEDAANAKTFTTRLEWWGTLELPPEGGDLSPIRFFATDVLFSRDAIEPIDVSLGRVALDVETLAEPVECHPVGDALLTLTKPS